MIRGGGSLVDYRPVFSVDGKLLLVCTGCTVSVFSVATGLLVTQVRGHKDRVTSVVVVQDSGPTKSVLHHAWTSSLDGTLRLWDFGIGVRIKTVDIGHPVWSMVIPNWFSPAEKAKPMTAFLSVGYKQDGPKPEDVKGQGRVLVYNLTTFSPLPGYLAKTESPRLLEASQSGSLVGMVDKSKVWVWRVPSVKFKLKDVEVLLLHHVRELRVLAFDPTDTVVAAGDKTGRILLWQNVGEGKFGGAVGSGDTKRGLKRKLEDGSAENQKESRQNDDAQAVTTYHWHSHEVKLLTFSADGVYLLSGGLEAVLVIWHVETGNKDFVPRLGGPLLFISKAPDPASFSVSCADNSIMFFNFGNRSVERGIHGIKPPAIQSKQVGIVKKSGVVIEPVEGIMALTTENVSVQFYDIFQDRHLAEIQVFPRNYLPTPDKAEGPSPPLTLVTHVAFSADGMVMVTVHSRLSEEELGGSSHLKFWDREVGVLRYTENTVAQENSAEISALAYHPSKHMVVSCIPFAAEFKVWVQDKRAGLQEEGKLFRWSCRSVGSYRRKRILSAAFSPDGSLLAVAAEEVVTLWNPITNGIVTVLSSAPPQPIFSLSFIPKSQHLVALTNGTKGEILVWNLETLTLQLRIGLRAEALAVDPSNPQFAVILSPPSITGGVDSSSSSVVAVFNADQISPVAVWNVRNAQGGSLAFLPPHLQPEQERRPGEAGLRSYLLVSTATREFVVLDPLWPGCTEAEDTPITERLPEDEDNSALTAMYGKSVQRRARVEAPEVSRIGGNRPWGDLFNCPSHVLPPLSRIGLPFIDSFLSKVK